MATSILATAHIRMLERFGVSVEDLFVVESGGAPWADLDFRRAIADRYSIDRELGQGGMGGVYLARDARHGHTVAIKVISTEIVSGIGLDQFHREIGVIADLRRQQLREEPFLALFWPMGVGGDQPPPSPQILVRMRTDVRRAEPLIRRVLLDVDRNQPYVTIVPYESFVDPKARSWRLGASVLSAFGALSLLLAAVGVYAVLSYVVASRTREIGVRAALGASPGAVMRTVILRGSLAAVAGVMLGSVLALAMGPQIEGLLFETSPRVDPLVALRAE